MPRAASGVQGSWCWLLPIPRNLWKWRPSLEHLEHPEQTSAAELSSGPVEFIQESPGALQGDLQVRDDPLEVKFPGFLHSNGWHSSCTFAS